MSFNLDEYIASTFEDRLLVKMPEREEDHLTPATRLLEKRREMAEVEQALAAQREEFQMKMESLQQRREELERKEFQLQESLKRFDKFLKENDLKFTRATKKFEEEKETIVQKADEINKFEEDLAIMSDKKDKMDKVLRKHKVFKDYLERVVEKAEEFHEIRELIARFDTLTTTNKDLLARDSANQDLIEEHRTVQMRWEEEKETEIMRYNNRLSNLQSDLENAQGDALTWENEWNHIKATAAEKTLVLGKIRLAIHNTYQLIMKYGQAEGSLPVEETDAQLVKIKTFLKDLIDIHMDLKRTETSKSTVTSNSL